MAIVFQPDPSHGPETAQSAAPARSSARTSTPRPAVQNTPQKSSESVSQKSVSSMQQETNVAFRRDTNGQIYYVFTDAETGRELQEIPPKKVREVGQGIADLVKELQQKNSNHLEVQG